MKALPLIDPIARRLRRQLGPAVDLDDLRSIGHLAVMDLVRRYDPERAPFEPYMRTRLRWAILDGVRRQTHGRVLAARARALSTSDRLSADAAPDSQTGGMPPSEGSFKQRLVRILRDHAAVIGVKLIADHHGESAVTPSSANPERATLHRSALETVREVVASLEDERQRQIVERHYFGGEPFAAIAASLGLSKAWVSRLHAQAIGVIEKRLRARGISR
jgi:RNA polymerase sigma factor for flagellar operon FliA